MPRPSRRSGSRKRLSKTLPGGRRTIHYKRRSISSPNCGLCNKPIAGISHLSLAEVYKMNRTQKRVSRPYGGHLCGKCLRNGLRQAARHP